MFIASYLHFSDLQAVSKVCLIFNEIFNKDFKDYKQFYELITWNSDDWDKTLNDHFENVLTSIREVLPYENVYRIKLLKASFLRVLSLQSILEHVCFCVKSNCPGKYKNKCLLCSPVYFYDSELHYYENFHVRLPCHEVKIVKNLYKKCVFDFFVSKPNNWFHRLNTN